MSELSALDLLIIWLTPVLAGLLAYLAFVFAVYLLIRRSRELAFRADVLDKVSKKTVLRSAGGRRFSYRYLLALLTLDNGTQAAFLYRLSHYFATRRSRLTASVIHSFAKFLTHIDVSPQAEIGPGISFYHGTGIVIGKLTRIGSQVTICQGVTTGGGRPDIGDDVTLWAGAKIIGDVTIGPRAQVGANAVVIGDVPAACIAVGIPANRFLPIPDAQEQGAPATAGEIGS